MFQYQVVGVQFVGVQFYYYGGWMYYWFQVGVQVLQYDWFFGSVFQVDVEGFELGYLGFFQVLEIKGVVDVFVVVYVVLVYWDMGCVQ